MAPGAQKLLICYHHFPVLARHTYLLLKNLIRIFLNGDNLRWTLINTKGRFYELLVRDRGLLELWGLGKVATFAIGVSIKYRTDGIFSIHYTVPCKFNHGTTMIQFAG